MSCNVLFLLVMKKFFTAQIQGSYSELWNDRLNYLNGIDKGLSSVIPTHIAVE